MHNTWEMLTVRPITKVSDLRLQRGEDDLHVAASGNLYRAMTLRALQLYGLITTNFWCLQAGIYHVA